MSTTICDVPANPKKVAGKGEETAEFKGRVRYRPGFRPQPGEEAFLVASWSYSPRGIYRCVITRIDLPANDEDQDRCREAKCAAVITALPGRNAEPLPEEMLVEPEPVSDDTPEPYQVMSGSDAVAYVLRLLSYSEEEARELRTRKYVESQAVHDFIDTVRDAIESRTREVERRKRDRARKSRAAKGAKSAKGKKVRK